MSDENAGEYGLADLPEPPKKRPTPPPEKPLPRLWKTESEEKEDSAGPAKGKQEAADNEAKPAARTSEPRRRSRAEKPKEVKKPAEGGEKKVLVEETPALDTYEARQRARLLVGGLVVGCFLIFGYVFYQLFVYDPMTVEPTGDEPPPTVAAPGPATAKRDLDVEARSMLKRAEEADKAKRVSQATEILETVSKSYKGTKSATAAKAALDRFKQGLPLFGPAVKAEQAARKPAPAPAPPAIVQAQTRQTTGNATLTLPANPAELTPTSPSPLAMGPAPGAASPGSPPIRMLPEGFAASREAGVHSSGWPLVIIGKRDGTPMMLVPGGSFLMGNDNGSPAEAPAHKVRLTTYYIDQHEVTVRQFLLFLAETHYHGQPTHSWSEDFRKNPSDTLPMVMVNARDAQAYADWALKKLPTEAQWEMAARSTDGRLYPWGSDRKAASHPSGEWKLQPAKANPADVSPYGVFDMGGNAMEWTKDWYDSKYYHQLPLGAADNPTGPATRPRTMELVVKCDRKSGSASSRQGMMLEKRLPYVGFRCVLPVQEQLAVMPGPAVPGAVPPAAPAGRPPGTPPGQGNSQAPPPPF